MTNEDKSSIAQIKKVDCDLRALADKINGDQNTVPKEILHFGKKEYLDQNIAQKNIPQDIWDKNIMGEDTRFNMAKNRRGLYGTAGIDTNTFGSDTYNWLMQIQIKDECRNPNQVTTMLNMPNSVRFKAWLAKTQKDAGLKSKLSFSSNQQFQEKCYNGATPLTELDGTFYGNKACQEMMDFYLENSQVRVLQDHVIPKSFYIRDRSCIQSIRGTPQDLIQLAAKSDLMWITPCGSNEGAVAFSEVLAHALALYEEPLSDDIVNDLIEKEKISRAKTYRLETYKRCSQKGQLAQYRDYMKNHPTEDIAGYYMDVCK